MPNRILRDYTDSYKFENLSPEGERLFIRLIMKADDFGQYHADPRLVRAGCFPLLKNLRDTDVSRWLAECEKAGLIAVYQVSGRNYLTIVNFRQRSRSQPKFPHPVADCQSIDGQLTAQAEAYSETYSEAEARASPRAPPLPHANSDAIPSRREFDAEFVRDGIPADYLQKQWLWFDSNDAWRNAHHRLKKWAAIVRQRWVEDRSKWLAAKRQHPEQNRSYSPNI